MTTETKSNLTPLPTTGVIATGYEDDEIRQVGDNIAALTEKDAKELGEYLKGVI